MKNLIKWPSKTVMGERAFSVRLICSLKIEYTVLKAQNLRGRKASDIRNDARMVFDIPERSTEP